MTSTSGKSVTAHIHTHTRTHRELVLSQVLRISINVIRASLAYVDGVDL